MTPENAVRRWGLAGLTPLARSPRAVLWTAALPDASPVVLKILTERGSDEIIGARLLRWLGGRGAVRLLARSGRAMLLEHLPGPPLSDMVGQGRDLDAGRALGQIARNIAGAGGRPPSGLMPLERYFARLFDRTQPWPPGLAAEVGRARGLARALLASAPSPRPLHGDLHHDNILFSPRGWLAIDPKGLLGDPAFDLANALRNPAGRQDLARDPARAQALAGVLAGAAGVPAPRILAWAGVLAVTSVGWVMEDGEPLDAALALIGPLLSHAPDL